METKKIRVFRCECGLEMVAKAHIQRHLNAKRSCNKEKNMSLINVETLITYVDKLQEKKTPQSFEGLTQEKRKEKELERNRKADNTRYLKQSSFGYMSEYQYASYVQQNTIQGTVKRNKKLKENNLPIHIVPPWSKTETLKILQDNIVYKIHDTIVGTLEFPLRLTNGYFNSASIDRIDDSKGYIDNYEIRPQFLNCLYKLTTDNLKELVKIREEKQTIDELNKISKIIKNKKHHENFFRCLAHSCKTVLLNKDKSRNLTFDFESEEECLKFIIQQYIKQGGRCAYSNVPIYPSIKHKFKVSVERVNPRLSYNKNNMILIVVGLNTRPCGQFLNEKLTEEQREIALQNGKFNQDYWDTCTKLTSERKQRCDETKEHDKNYLLSLDII